MERKLILIKHASPLVEPGKPAQEWSLSDAGRAACDVLADRLARNSLSQIVSSQEPKARQTAERVGAKLDVPVCSSEGLGEHDRSNVPHLRSAEFISMMELFFRRPRELVLGRETAQQAEDRFAGAVVDVLEQFPQGNLGVVSHGTVIALFAARHGEEKPFHLWRAMGLPSFLVFELPGYELVERQDRI